MFEGKRGGLSEYRGEKVSGKKRKRGGHPASQSGSRIKLNPPITIGREGLDKMAGEVWSSAGAHSTVEQDILISQFHI